MDLLQARSPDSDGTRSWSTRELRSIAILSFTFGVILSIGWSYRSNGFGTYVKQLTKITVVLEDQGCDSGFDLSWLNGASLTNLDGSKIQTISPLNRDESCSPDFPAYYVDFLVEPTKSYIYRISIPGTSMESEQELVAVDTLISLSDNPYVSFRLSLDCPRGQRICERT